MAILDRDVNGSLTILKHKYVVIEHLCCELTKPSMKLEYVYSFQLTFDGRVGLLPSANKSLTTLIWPDRAAMCNEFSPFWKENTVHQSANQ